MSPEFRRRIRPWTLAAAGYIALTIIQTWPLTARLSSVVPNDLGDPVLNTWIVWWNAHAAPLSAAWWNGPMFFPSTGSLAFSETLLGLAPVTDPIQWLGGSPVTAYNVAFLLTFPLSALAMHALVHRLTGRHDAAVVGGLIFGFNPFRVAHFPQIQMLTGFWMVFALLGLHGYVSTRRPRYLWLFAVSWLMQALSNGYFLLFFPVLMGVWMLWFTFSRAEARTFVKIAAAWTAATLVLVPYLWEYRHILASYGMHRGHRGGDAQGADVSGLLNASPLLKFWKVEVFRQSEGELFPGVTAAVLAVLLVAVWLWRRRSAHAASPRATRALVALAVVSLAFGCSFLWFGPWAFTVGSATLISVHAMHKPISLAIVCLALAAAADPAIRAAWRRRSVALFYLLATILMYLCAFGPEPRLLGTPILYKINPYFWLLALPGYDDVRVPGRFAMLAALCLSVVAALSFARLVRGMKPATRAIAAVVVAGGVLVDNWMDHMPVPAPPERLRTLDALPAGPAVLELPIGQTGDDFGAMYRAMFHGHRLINGFSGFFPKSFDVLAEGLMAGDPALLDAVTWWGPVVVAVREDHDLAKRWIAEIESRPGVTAMGEEAGRRFFLMPGGKLPAVPQFAAKLPVTTMTANVNQRLVPFALDGDPSTRWESGPQRGVEVVTIDLGQPRTIDGITMTIGSHPADFPRMLTIESSPDGLTWTEEWRGRSAGAAFAGAVADPETLPLTFELPHVSARWLRLRQTDSDPVFYWTIADLTVYGR